MFSLINLTNIVLFITFFIYIVLIFLLSRRKNKVSLYFSLFIGSVALWILCILFANIASSNYMLLFFTRLAFVGPSLLGPFFLLFIESFPRKSINVSKFLKLLFIIAALVLIFLSFTPLIIKDAYYDNVLSPHYVYGSLYSLIFIYVVFVFTTSLIILSKKFRISTNIEREQIKYIFIGTLVTVFLGVFSNSLLPILGYSDLGKFGPLSTLVFLSFTTYAITRYRLMDIKLVILRSLTFGFIVFVAGGIFAIVSTLITSLFVDYAGIRSNIASGVIIATLLILLYKPLHSLIERATNTFLFKKSYNKDILLSQISDIAARYIQMDRLSSSIYKILDDAFHFEKFGISLLESDGKLKIIYKKGFKANEAEKLVAYPDLAVIFEKELKINKGSLAIEEMMTRYENKEFEPVDANLLRAVYHNNIAVAIPLYVKNNLIGMMVLGSKKSGDPYTQQDINVLEIIGGQMAVAIDNARLYEELRYFNLKLEEEVREKTKQLRVANEDLQKLDRAKSEFISIASHQLRTPLTVIKGYISMMKEGSFGPIRPKILQNLDKVYVSNERLITLVENLLDISRIESGRQEFAWKKIQLEDLAAEVTEKLQDSARKKKLKLAFHNSSEKLPPVIVDDGKIHEVMMNFVDNAVKYTDKGKVDVFVKKEKEFITFCVKDTGKGISEEGKKKLFQKFSRGKDSFRQHTEGLGLGLYVATMMMKAHGGRIWADSPGEGMGSEFCFSIPVKSNHKDGEVSKIDERVVQEANEQEKKEVLAE